MARKIRSIFGVVLAQCAVWLLVVPLVAWLCFVNWGVDGAVVGFMSAHSIIVVLSVFGIPVKWIAEI